MSLDNRGQAYSTFKLLIAAIVALAILMILMPIIGSVLQIFQNDPQDKTIELLNDLYAKPEAIKTTDEVSFSPDYVLSAAALSQRVPLSSEQICMSLGDFKDNDDFDLRDKSSAPHRIIWNGSSAITIKVVVTCNLDESSFDDSLDGTVFDERGWDYDCKICEDKGRCCLLALKNP